MEQELFSIIKPLIATSPLAITVYILYKSGVLGALSSRIRKNSDNQNNKQVKNLEDWKQWVEKNHFHDLEDLKEDVRDIKKQINEIDKRVAVVESRINND